MNEPAKITAEFNIAAEAEAAVGLGMPDIAKTLALMALVRARPNPVTDEDRKAVINSLRGHSDPSGYDKLTDEQKAEVAAAIGQREKYHLFFYYGEADDRSIGCDAFDTLEAALARVHELSEYDSDICFIVVRGEKVAGDC